MKRRHKRKACSTPIQQNLYAANGTSNGIVWCISAGGAGVLYAFSASNIATQLYNSNQASARDQFPDNSSDKFVTPLIANGKVFAGTPTGVVVFGLLNP